MTIALLSVELYLPMSQSLKDKRMVLRRLKDTYGDAARVWPFETGFKPLGEADLSGVDMVLAEVYPSMIKPQGAAGEVRQSARNA